MSEMDGRSLSYTLDDVYALIAKIPSVLACRMMEEDGAIREMHVLALDTRSPKQIARDIQSALLARFSLAIDHRYISIAQIPGEMNAASKAPAAPSRLVSTKLSLSLDQTTVDATVTLALGDKVIAATEHGEKFGLGRQRAVALATVRAINCFLAQHEQLYLTDLSECFLSGKRVLLAAVLYEDASCREELVGAAYDRGNNDDAVIHAVLDAVNRKLRL